jgi:hypothetical protein
MMKPQPSYPVQPPTTTIQTIPTTTSTDTKQLSFQDLQKYFVEAKYFMIKSANYYNIERSATFGEWATTKSNEVY